MKHKFDYGVKTVVAKDGFSYLIDIDNIESGFIGAYLTQWANGYELFYSNNSISYSKEYISHRVIASNNPQLSHLSYINKTPKYE